MAKKFQSLNFPGESLDTKVQEPGEEIQSYDNALNSSELANMLMGPSQDQMQQQRVMDEYMTGLASQQYGQELNRGLTDPMKGDVETGELYMPDPDQVMASWTSDVGRALRQGWGGLISNTGDTVDFLNALVSPSDPDPNTSLGDWFRKKGQETQNENLLIASSDLDDITWVDLFSPEFWSHKVAPVVPYAASFIIPYAGGASISGKFGGALLTRAAKSGKIGTMGRMVSTTTSGSKVSKLLYGTNRVGGSGLAKHIAIDAGKKGVILTKGAEKWTRAIGGGLAANITEGAFLAGETYNQGLKMGLNPNEIYEAPQGGRDYVL